MRYRCGAFFSRTLSVAFITAFGTVGGMQAAWAQGQKPAVVSAPAAPSPKAVGPSVPAGKPVAAKPVAKPVAATPAAPATAASTASAPTPGGKPKVAPSKAAQLEERAQALKKEVQQLNQELQSLEQAVMYPPSGQVAVFVAVAPIKGFVLESVELKQADKVIAQHLYTSAEQAAIQRGGVQRLYAGAVKPGEHEWQATITGKFASDRAVKRQATIKFEKGSDPKYVQLRIEDTGGQSQPEMAVKVWH